MFWRKKNIVRASDGVAGQETKKKAGPEGDLESGLKVVKQKKEKLPGARPLPKVITRYLVDQYKIDEDMTKVLNMVMIHHPEKEKAFHFRIFDIEEAAALNFPVKDYAALNTHPELILYEGRVDRDSDQVEMNEKRKMEYDVPLLTKSEIKEKIEGLREPGSTVFFYQARGPAAGGPLGRGAAIVELNPELKNKKALRYIVYTSNMFGRELVGPRNKLWQSNDAERIADWIQDSHHKRAY